MAGLLSDVGDWIYGDDKVKDADGLTQYDRRQPYFAGAASGLGKMGGLLMAAGMPLHNEQRAQLLAQAGSALGNVPSEIIAAREAQSKGILQKQTVLANRTKLANQAKIQEMGRSPEAQAALAKLDPTRRMAMQAAYDAGDIKEVVDILESTDRAALGAERLQLLTERQKQLADTAAGQHAVRVGQLDNSTRALELKQQEAERKANEDFPGNSEVAIALRNLKKDPSSYAYWSAHQFFNTERTLQDGTKVGKANLSGLPPPTWKHPNAPAVDAATDPVQVAAGMKPGNTRTLDNGTKVIHEADGVIRIEYPGGKVTEQKGPTGQVETRPPPKPVTGDAMKVFSNNLQQIDKVEQLNDELDAHPDAAVGTAAAHILSRLPAGTVGPQALNAYDPKGAKARQLIADLNSMQVHDRTGAAVGVAEYTRFADFIPLPTDSPERVRSKIQGLKRAIDLENRLYRDNIGKGFMVPSQVSERYDPPKEGDYVLPDGKTTVTWDEIKQAAENRDISTNDVIRKLRARHKVK